MRSGPGSFNSTVDAATGAGTKHVSAGLVPLLSLGGCGLLFAGPSEFGCWLAAFGVVVTLQPHNAYSRSMIRAASAAAAVSETEIEKAVPMLEDEYQEQRLKIPCRIFSVGHDTCRHLYTPASARTQPGNIKRFNFFFRFPQSCPIPPTPASYFSASLFFLDKAQRAA